MADIDSFVISGTLYTVTDSGATKTVELTQQQYDALQVKDPNTLYIISDATPIGVTSAITSGSTDAVTSGAVYDAIGDIETLLNNL